MPESTDTPNTSFLKPGEMTDFDKHMLVKTRNEPDDQRPTMSTREIAEITGKAHQHVLRDAEIMLTALELPPEGYVQNWTHPQNGQTYRQFALPQDLTITLVAGYDAKLRHRIIVRWQELEGRTPTIDPLRALNDPVMMRGLLLTYSEKVIQLETVNAEMMPKADAYDLIAATDGSFTSTEVAKTLGEPPRKFQSWLRMNRWTYRRVGTADDVAYQDKLDAGLLCHKTQVVPRADGSEKVITRARVTPKGLARLATIFGTEHREVA
jgi:phage antirepressor YoqD-like protein